MTSNTPKAARALQHLDDDMILTAAGEPRRRRTAWGALAACLAAVILAAAAAPGLLGTGAVETVVALDVNPSMEIHVDKNEKVISVTPLNDDARIVIGDMDLKQVDLDVAVNALVGSLLQNGYLTIDRNSILVSVDAYDAAKGAALQQELSAEVSRLLEDSNLQASVLTQSYTSSGAASSAISPAKDALVRKIAALNMTDSNGVPYTYEHLSSLNIHELKQLVESRSLTVDQVTSTGTAATSGYIGQEAALNAALSHAGLTASDITATEWELDHGHGCMVYGVEFCAGGYEYEYDINAATGAVVTCKYEYCDEGGHGHGRYDDDRNGHHNGSHGGYGPSADGMLGAGILVDKALAHAGVSRTDIWNLEVDYDTENGRNVCEVSFDSAGMEYEVTLDAVTGQVLFYETERDE